MTVFKLVRKEVKEVLTTKKPRKIRKDTSIYLRATQNFKDRLGTAAVILERSEADLIRTAVNEHLITLAAKHPKLKAALEGRR